MRARLIYALTVAALACAGCGQLASPSAPTALGTGGSSLTASPNSASAPLAGREGAVAVPFKGRLDGEVTVTPVPGGPFANVFIEATGEATYLGHFTLSAPHLVNFATAVGEGSFTFTAANGDTLTAHFTGTADTSTPVFSIVEHATVTGGTGRFAGATGNFTAERLYDPVAGTTTGSLEGTITF